MKIRKNDQRWSRSMINKYQKAWSTKPLKHDHQSDETMINNLSNRWSWFDHWLHTDLSTDDSERGSFFDIFTLEQWSSNRFLHSIYSNCFVVYTKTWNWNDKSSREIRLYHVSDRKDDHGRDFVFQFYLSIAISEFLWLQK